MFSIIKITRGFRPRTWAAVIAGLLVLTAWDRARFGAGFAYINWNSGCIFAQNSPDGVVLMKQSEPLPRLYWQHFVHGFSAEIIPTPYRCLPMREYAVDSLDAACHGVTIEWIDASRIADNIPGFVVIIPHLALLFACLVPAIAFRGRKKGFTAGLCKNCGYDIRACAETCSECGTPLSGQSERPERRPLLYRYIAVPLSIRTAAAVFVVGGFVRTACPSDSSFRCVHVYSTSQFAESFLGFDPVSPQPFLDVSNLSALVTIPLNYQWVHVPHPGFCSSAIFVACTTFNCAFWGFFLSRAWIGLRNCLKDKRILNGTALGQNRPI